MDHYGAPNQTQSAQSAYERAAKAARYEVARGEETGPTGQPAPPQQILEVVLTRLSQQLEQLQQLRKRTNALADRLLGCCPADPAANSTPVDPGNVVGRLETLQGMIERQLQAIFDELQRLERL
jgi:hypothetical protein